MVKSLISKGLTVPHRWEKRYILLHTAMNYYRPNCCLGNELAINQKLI